MRILYPVPNRQITVSTTKIVNKGPCQQIWETNLIFVLTFSDVLTADFDLGSQETLEKI